MPPDEKSGLGGLKSGDETFLRLSGYKEAMNIAGHEINESLINFGDYTGKAGYKSMVQQLTSHFYIDEQFSSSDLMAVGAIEAIREKGLIAGKNHPILTNTFQYYSLIRSVFRICTLSLSMGIKSEESWRQVRMIILIF